MKASKSINSEIELWLGVEKYMQAENITSESEAVERLLTEILLKKGHIKNSKGGN